MIRVIICLITVLLCTSESFARPRRKMKFFSTKEQSGGSLNLFSRNKESQSRTREKKVAPTRKVRRVEQFNPGIQNKEKRGIFSRLFGRKKKEEAPIERYRPVTRKIEPDRKKVQEEDIIIPISRNSIAPKFEINTHLGALSRSAEKMQSMINNDEIDLEPSYKSGTSAYGLFEYGGEVGAILPENSATVVLGEVASYKLSVALGFEEIYSKKTVIGLSGQGLRKLHNTISPLTGHSSKMKRNNAKMILTRINRAIRKNSNFMVGYAPWNLPKPLTNDRLVSGNTLRSSHPLIKALGGSESNKSIVGSTLKKDLGLSSSVQANSVQLLKDFSNMSVVDVLVNQWDRHSGGNIQLYVRNNTLRFGAYDNGGAFENSSKRRSYVLSKLKRFDANTYSGILDLNDFVNGSGKSRNFSSVSEFRNFLELDNNHDTLRKSYLSNTGFKAGDVYWRQFKSALSSLAKHMKKVCQAEGSSCFID